MLVFSSLSVLFFLLCFVHSILQRKHEISVWLIYSRWIICFVYCIWYPYVCACVRACGWIGGVFMLRTISKLFQMAPIAHVELESFHLTQANAFRFVGFVFAFCCEWFVWTIHFPFSFELRRWYCIVYDSNFLHFLTTIGRLSKFWRIIYIIKRIWLTFSVLQVWNISEQKCKQQNRMTNSGGNEKHTKSQKLLNYKNENFVLNEFSV